ncbi:hypothetical protein AgCh_016549 [Apium graveolens]
MSGIQSKTSPVLTSSDFGKEIAAFANTCIDWKETPEAHMFKADLPGLEKEEVASHGKKLRRLRLPEDAKVDEVKAGMENGVLTVTVTKMEVKSIDISG